VKCEGGGNTGGAEYAVVFLRGNGAGVGRGYGAGVRGEVRGRSREEHVTCNFGRAGIGSPIISALSALAQNRGPVWLPATDTSALLNHYPRTPRTPVWLPRVRAVRTCAELHIFMAEPHVPAIPITDAHPPTAPEPHYTHPPPLPSSPPRAFPPALSQSLLLTPPPKSDNRWGQGGDGA
jgi:hypothetical protein